jgi:hypothetical protein
MAEELTTQSVRLPNGRVIEGIPRGTSVEEIRRVAIDSGQALPSDFPSEAGASTTPAPERPWYEKTGDFLGNNMEIPLGIGGSIAGGIAGALLGPVGAITGAVIGGAVGSGGGSLLSDNLQGQELDYGRATQEALISAGVDLGTLGLGKVLKPAFVAARARLGFSPQDTADYILRQAIDGADVGSRESLLASQRILRESGTGATLTPFQTGNANALQTFGQKIGEIGLGSRQISEANVSAVNQATSDALTEIITRSGTEVGINPSALGEAMYSVITSGKKALSDFYGQGLSELQETLGNSVVSIQGVKNSLNTFLHQHQREGFSTLNDQTVAYVSKLIEDFKSVPNMKASHLLDLEKKIVDDISQFGNLDSGVYNTVVERQLVQLSNDLRGAMGRALDNATPGASAQFSALKQAYSEGIGGMLPEINKTFVKNASRENFTSLGRMLTQSGNTDQVRTFMRSIDTAYNQIDNALAREGTVSAPFASAADAKEAIKQGFLRQMFPNLGREFDVSTYANLADRFNRPADKARLKLIMGDDYMRFKQITNLMKEASEKPTSNVGELVIRSAEYGSLGAAALGTSGPSLGAAGVILLGPIGLAKLSTNQNLMTRMIALQKGKFPTGQALTAFAANIATDLYRTLDDEEQQSLRREFNALEGDVPQ